MGQGSHALNVNRVELLIPKRPRLYNSGGHRIRKSCDRRNAPAL
jgi:hypothetical protein